MASDPDRTPAASIARTIWRIVRPIAAAYAIIVVLAFLFQRKLQYFPDPSPVPLPRGEPYRGLEEFETRTADGVRLRGWYWPGERPITLLIFHGNAGHRGHRLEWLGDFHSLGLGVCLPDYRGYGGSEGSASEEGLYRDADAAISWLQSRLGTAPGPQGIVYYGESLGGAVAVELATRRPPAALILQSAFTSAVDVGQRAYPFLPVRMLLRDRLDSRSRIERVSVPALVIHGDADSIVPMDFGQALFAAAREPKEWYAVPGADHNDLPWIGGRAYLERVDAFLKRHVEKRD